MLIYVCPAALEDCSFTYNYYEGAGNDGVDLCHPHRQGEGEGQGQEGGGVLQIGNGGGSSGKY